MATIDPELASRGELGPRTEQALEVALQRALGAELIDSADPTSGVRSPVTGLAVTPVGTLHAPTDTTAGITTLSNDAFDVAFCESMSRIGPPDL